MSPGRLASRTVFLPRMPASHAALTAAAFQGFGIEARMSPESTPRTLQLGRSYCSGEECYPLVITLGDFLRVLIDDGYPPERAAFFMPTSSGPCRFGQYADYMRTVFADHGYSDAMVLSPTSENAYDGLGAGSSRLLRASWRGFVAADFLVAMLLSRRPYEIRRGEMDHAFGGAIAGLCTVLGDPSTTLSMRAFLAAVRRGRDLLRDVPACVESRPLIGVVGEIFCRNNAFSNMELVRHLETHGAECWMPGVTEWVHYTNLEEMRRLRRRGRQSSVSRMKAGLRHRLQHADYGAIASQFRVTVAHRPEPAVSELLPLGDPYLPSQGALGEMALSVARAVYLWQHGAAGVVDISPFACMNAIVAEAIYPRVSLECGGMPIRTFYFDGTQANLDRDIGVFLELARSYQRRRDALSRVPPAAVTHTSCA